MEDFRGVGPGLFPENKFQAKYEVSSISSSSRLCSDFGWDVMVQGPMSLDQLERKIGLLQEFIHTFRRVDPGLTKLVASSQLT